MTQFRFIPLAIALTAAVALTACNTAPTMMPMSMASANSMATPDQTAQMDAHMKTMQDGMAMMEGMSGAGMKGMPGMAGDMGARQQMMEKRMEMMQSMMKMMMDRMPAAPAK